jgi:uncharacterized membrane protein
MTASPLVAGAAFVAAYGIASHWLMVNAATAPWAVAVLFGPLLGAIAFGAWRGRQWPLVAFCAACAVAIVVVVAHGGVQDVQRMYVLQHAAIHAVLAWTFARTLGAGQTPLIVALAERVHRHFTPSMREYATGVTRLWAGYFVAMIGLSLAIYTLAPWPWWSLYCNLLTPLAVALLFVGEHVWRYWRHPDFERVSISGAVAAWRAHSSRDAGAAS